MNSSSCFIHIKKICRISGQELPTHKPKTLLESAPNPSVQGQYVTFTAAVRFVATKAPVSQGHVSFNMHTGPDVRMIQPKVARYGVVLQQLGRQPISNGVATLRTNMPPKGIIRVTATFPAPERSPAQTLVNRYMTLT